MESFEFYMSEFISNAENVTYEKSSTYAEIRRSNDYFLKEEELSTILSDRFADRVSDIASHLGDENARVRRSVAYLLLGKMKPSDKTIQTAMRTLEEYADNARGDEALMARGFLLAYADKRHMDTSAAVAVSLMSSLRKKYICD